VSGPIAYVYYEEQLANLLGRDERVAANVAKLPEGLGVASNCQKETQRHASKQTNRVRIKQTS
jgi:hypothetical protein